MVHIQKLIVIAILFIQRQQSAQSLSVPQFLEIFFTTAGITTVTAGYMPRMYTVLL
ncbi:hypothetical protein VU11_07850 [Desulfobulbus sp. US2]|nr:hypothetical protein [Desulfobulbus sp. US4]MCW5208536.1 hypothetical protein [Desulfobulbus sp. US2]